jgi:hypothetical protein
MKKFVLFISLFALSVLSVQARENKLYFTEENNRLYYESKLIDEDIFMKHIDMTPGESFTDELLIENGTNTKYTLYFKVVPREQSAEADELLENIIMKIKLDEEIIYEGKATGLDYTEQGIDLQKAILLGDFTPSKNSKMVVETKLSENYDNTELNEFSYIDWSFYAQYDDSKPPVEIIVSPNTMRNSFPYTIVFSAIIILIGIGIVKSAYKKKN